MRTKTMRNTCSLLILILLTSFCNLDAQKKNRKYIAELMKVDKEFSDFSVANGMNKAFFEFSDESVVLLKPDMLPLKGMEELKKFHKNIIDSLFTLSWTPSFAKSGKKGDLGYTYGVWKLKGENIYSEGTYVSIWSKNKDGKWKLILDTGNEGLGKKK